MNHIEDLSENIIHDILDELTDYSEFNQWWYEITPEAREEVEAVLLGLVCSNIHRVGDLLNEEPFDLDLDEALGEIFK
jgi:hypothetical protein